jgi:hypothetical protein
MTSKGLWQHLMELAPVGLNQWRSDTTSLTKTLVDRGFPTLEGPLVSALDGAIGQDMGFGWDVARDGDEYVFTRRK